MGITVGKKIMFARVMFVVPCKHLVPPRRTKPLQNKTFIPLSVNRKIKFVKPTVLRGVIKFVVCAPSSIREFSSLRDRVLQAPGAQQLFLITQKKKLNSLRS